MTICKRTGNEMFLLRDLHGIKRSMLEWTGNKPLRKVEERHFWETGRRIVEIIGKTWRDWRDLKGFGQESWRKLGNNYVERISFQKMGRTLPIVPYNILIGLLTVLCEFLVLPSVFLRFLLSSKLEFSPISSQYSVSLLHQFRSSSFQDSGSVTTDYKLCRKTPKTKTLCKGTQWN